jgi:hypothetical protein
MGKKTDKLVGGNKVELPKVAWSAQIDLDPGKDSFITLSGTASDEIAAALAANAARKAILDSLNAEEQLKDPDPVQDMITGAADLAKKVSPPRSAPIR